MLTYSMGVSVGGGTSFLPPITEELRLNLLESRLMKRFIRCGNPV